MAETPAVETPAAETPVAEAPTTTTTVTITKGKKGGGSMGLAIIALIGGLYRLRRQNIYSRKSKRMLESVK